MLMLFDTYSQDTVFKRVSTLIDGMTLDKSLTAKLSRTTRLYCALASKLDGSGADTAVRKKEKDGRNWLHVDPDNNRSWFQRAISLSDDYYY